MVFKCIYSAPYGGGIFTRQHDAVVVDAPSFTQDDGYYTNEQVHNPVFCRHQVQYSPSSSGSELQIRRKYHQSTYHRNTPVQTYMPYTGAVRIRSYYTSPSTTNTYRTHSVDPSSSYYQRQTYNNVQESRNPPMATPYFPRKALPADENRDLASSYFVPQQTNDVMKIRDVAPASSYFVQRQNDVQDNIAAPATSYSQPQNNAVQDVAPAKCSSCYDVNSNFQENRDLTVAPASSYFSQQTSTVQENRDVAPASSYSLQQTSTVTENKNVARTPSYFQRSNVQENGDDFGPVCNNQSVFSG